jgi:hypothetical protein
MTRDRIAATLAAPCLIALGASGLVDAWPGRSALHFLVVDASTHVRPLTPLAIALVLAACIASARLRGGALRWSARVALLASLVPVVSSAWFVEFFGAELGWYYLETCGRLHVARGTFALAACVFGAVVWLLALRSRGWSRITFAVGAFWFFSAPLAGAFGDWSLDHASVGLIGPIAMLMAIGPLVLWAKWPRQSVSSTQSPSSLHTPPAQSSSSSH